MSAKPPTAKQLQVAARRVEKAEAGLEAARASRDEMVVAAVEAKLGSYREIAGWAGITFGRVGQLVKRLR